MKPQSREWFVASLPGMDAIRSHPFEHQGARIAPEQWVGLLNAEGQWLGRCCGNISDARDVLSEVLRRNHTILPVQAWDLCRNAGTHDGIREVFRGGSDEHFSAEGSPWPLIARVCRAVLGDAAYEAACCIEETRS